MAKPTTGGSSARKSPWNDRSEGWTDVVYCVQAIHLNGKKGPIKIGLSNSAGVNQRIRVLQASNYEKLVLLGIIRGDYDLEVSIQGSMKAHRIKGDWYAWNEQTEEIIKKTFACKTDK